MRGSGRSRSWWRSNGGNVATMTALTLPFGIVLAALAIDTGSLFMQRRNAQGFADLAAMTAAANLGRAEAAVVATLKDNGLGPVIVVRPGDPEDRGFGRVRETPSPTIVQVTTGHYSATGSLAVDRRFVAGDAQPNAVRVVLKRIGGRSFGEKMIQPPVIGVVSTAGVQSQAAFSIGSRLASVNGGVVNALLGTLVGGKLSLSVMDYNALLGADVEAFAMLEALATKLNLQAGSYDEVLASEATLGQIVGAMTSVAGQNNPALRAALSSVLLAQTQTARIPLRQLFDLGPAGRLGIGQRPAGLSADASVLDMLTAAAALANGASQVALDLGATVPGLLGATVQLAIGERPQGSGWFAIGPTGTLVRTAQTRMLLTVDIASALGLLGGSIRIPIYVELASAEATLSEIKCALPSPAPLSVTLATRPGVASLRIAEPSANSLAEFRRTPSFSAATLVKLPLVSVKGEALVDISNVTTTDLVFVGRDIAERKMKTASTRNVAQSLTKSLLSDLDLEVKVLVIGIGLSGLVKTAVGDALSLAAPAIDGLLMTLLDTLGVRIGEADVRVEGATCGRPALVQ